MRLRPADEAGHLVGRCGLARGVMWVVTRGSAALWGSVGWREAHSEHPLHVGHPRGIPRQWLVECLGELPDKVWAGGEARHGSRVWWGVARHSAHRTSLPC